MKNGNGNLQKNQVDSFPFPLVPAGRKPTEEQVVGFVREANRRIDEAGATLAQLCWMLGKALLHLQDLPRYGAHGKWEGWLRRWGVSQSRWMRAKRLAETYSSPDQLRQVPVDRALRIGAKGRKRTRRELVVSSQSNGQTYTPADGITMTCCDFRKLKVKDGSARAFGRIFRAVSDVSAVNDVSDARLWTTADGTEMNREWDSPSGGVVGKFFQLPLLLVFMGIRHSARQMGRLWPEISSPQEIRRSSGSFLARCRGGRGCRPHAARMPSGVGHREGIGRASWGECSKRGW